ncbi:hypothetical protein HZU77_014960 [Neisseriaceae bacterium TC5R-5]|nr:hypothetical protein [Neisseriaceae bacterium TC5R-5]
MVFVSRISPSYRRNVRLRWLLSLFCLLFPLTVLANSHCQQASAALTDCLKPPVSSATASSAVALKFRAGSQADEPMSAYGLVAGLLLLTAAVLWWRYFGKPRQRLASAAGPALYIAQQCRLSNKSMLYVVQHQDRQILLVEHEHGVTQLQDKPSE